MSPSCGVQLMNESAVYQPGQEVAGSVILTLEERTLFRFFAHTFSGYACTRWEKPAAKDRKSKSSTSGNVAERAAEHYEDREDYIATTTYMIGSESALPRIIDAGCYTYNFSVRLPSSCPPSLETTFGHIRYTLDVFIGHSLQTADELLVSRKITVTQPLDLRLNASLLEPVNIDCSELVKRTKFWQRPLQLHVNMPKTGYMPGERMSVYVKLLNDSHVMPTDLIYKLNRVANYHGYNKKNKPKTKLVKTNLLTAIHSLRAHSGPVFEHLTSLQLPETKPSLCQMQCRCLQQTYEVEVSVHTDDAKRSVAASIPIVVGTISLQDRRVEQQGATASGEKDEVKTEPSAPQATPDETDDNLSISLSSLTSFKEADFMPSQNLNKEFKHSMAARDEVNFKPKYLYYNLEDTH